ncbi:rhomboid family intramembrane serine protease [Paenibacillus sp. CAU 1782]
MIFLRYESFRGYLKNYPATAAIVLVNLIVFLITLAYGDRAYGYGVFFTDTVLDPFGLREPWRYLTSVFMHADFGHLFFNMFGLIIFAPPLEYLLKWKRYVPFYLLCGIGGNLISALMHLAGDSGYHLALGASGAIYGVYGAFLFIALHRRHMLDAASRNTVFLILGFGVIHSLLVSGIDLWGHIGGAISGYLLYSAMDTIKNRRRGASNG